ncbi:ATP-binding protein [Kutzneria sp. CA-103260]|uniref:ATP-binding protein n=1 Tax=Kutzneria sp. CA-103260 TaxID=2802641 RepID=UPI001BA8F4DD|nr:ATP-binding protein [Kutzneria sp. CA-103260]QUQ63889.1 ATP-dependent zinc metalloprotease FtsH [Kutzneria sp. CA-103260]
MSEPISRDLSARAATLAVRIADVLAAQCSTESGAGEAVDFLRTWAKEMAAPTLPGHPFDLLAQRFQLTEDERDLLLLAGLPEEHEGLAGTFRALHPRGEARPTLGLASLVLEGISGDRAKMRRLVHEGVLGCNGLVRLTGEDTLFERSVVIAPSLWDSLHGHDAWPAGMDRLLIGESPAGLAGWRQQSEVQLVVNALRSNETRTLLITADSEIVSLGRCAALAAEADVTMIAGRLSAEDTAGIALLAAHAAARDAVPVLVLTAQMEGKPAPELKLTSPGPVIVVAGPGSFRAGPGRPLLALPIGRSRHEEHRAAWRHALPDMADRAATLAARHPLDPALTAQTAMDVRSRQRLGGRALGVREISAAIRTRAGVALPPGVELTTPEVGWDRLVLPAEPADQLRAAVDRLAHEPTVLDDWGFRHHARASRGARLLFAGPPGTGKTLSAEVVAAAVGTDLITVDVSRVVSKWIGETEKNLAAVFDVAERTQAVLLFDEADALFATRTDVGDAHDRYANLETAYLLQRLDRFDGLVALATNLRHNIDPAFLRRMDFVVEFPQPDEACRRRLWALHLPAAVTGADVDTDVLARLYPVPGGWIRNAAIAAAFSAAAAADSVRQHHIVAAMRLEYAKAGRPFPGEPMKEMR